MLLKQSIFLSSIILALASFSGQTVEQRVKGCWVVQLGEWQPKTVFDKDSIYVTPPAKIELQDRYYYGVAGNRWNVLPANGAMPSVHHIVFFQSIGTDSIAIVWSTGYSGLSMRLAISQDTLRGTATTFWDFDRPQQTANVLLTRIECH